MQSIEGKIRDMYTQEVGEQHFILCCYFFFKWKVIRKIASGFANSTRQRQQQQHSVSVHAIYVWHVAIKEIISRVIDQIIIAMDAGCY